MRTRHVLVLASLGALAAVAACTLNPQPLPPGDLDRNAATNADGGRGGSQDAGDFGTDPERPQDAAAPPPDDQEGGAADGGDAGDAGDASLDAPADG